MCRMVNYIVILLGLSRYIILIFFRAPRGKLSWYFVWCLIVNYLDICRTAHGEIVDILSGVSILCWATRFGFSWYLFGCVAVNDRGISSDHLLWKFLTLVEHLLVNYSKFCRPSYGELSRYFFWRPKLNFLEIFSDVLLWIFFIFCRSLYYELCSYTVSIKYADLCLNVD